MKQIRDIFDKQLKAIDYTMSKTSQILSQLIEKSTLLANGTVEFAKETLEGIKEVDEFFKNTAGKAEEAVEGLIKDTAENVKEVGETVKDKTKDAVKDTFNFGKNVLGKANQVFGGGKTTGQTAPSLTGHTGPLWNLLKRWLKML